jgi:flagellar FliJ protein
LARFSFSLQAVLNFRQAKENQAKERLAGALQLCRREEEILENYQNQLAENLVPVPCGKLDLDRMVMGEQYCRSLEERIQVQTSRVLQAEKKVAVCRSQLEKARQELHMLEKLKEKKYGQYLYEENRREQLMLDDLALSRYRSKEDLL